MELELGEIASRASRKDRIPSYYLTAIERPAPVIELERWVGRATPLNKQLRANVVHAVVAAVGVTAETMMKKRKSMLAYCDSEEVMMVEVTARTKKHLRKRLEPS
jgi:hypothetical protein